MFSMFPKRVLSGHSNIAKSLQLPRFNSMLQTKNRAKEFQKVNLLGTIYQEPTTFKDGSKGISVKTVQSDSFYKVHRAVIRSAKLLSILGNHLSIGQRVYVSGDLRSTNFTNSENRIRQMFNVRVNEMYVSKVNEQESTEQGETPQACIDQNNIRILSHIASDIIHLDNHSMFNLVGHHLSKNPAEGEIEKAHFYRVFVHNPALINILKNSFERRDRVIVEGFLNSKPEFDEHGEKKHSSFIEATHFLKVDRFSEAIDENAYERV